MFYVRMRTFWTGTEQRRYRDFWDPGELSLHQNSNDYAGFTWTYGVDNPEAVRDLLLSMYANFGSSGPGPIIRRFHLHGDLRELTPIWPDGRSIVAIPYPYRHPSLVNIPYPYRPPNIHLTTPNRGVQLHQLTTIDLNWANKLDTLPSELELVSAALNL